MIRIRSILYKISFLIILLGSNRYVHAQLSMGARSLAMGHAATALEGDKWAIFSNPAMMDQDGYSLGFYGLRNYGFANLTDLAAVAMMKAGKGTVGLASKKYGDDLFSEVNIRTGLKIRWEGLHVGGVLSYNHLSFGGVYGSGGAFGIDLGIAAEISESLWIGARSTNLNRPSYGFVSGEEELPVEMAIGLTYQPERSVLIVMDMVKDVRFPVSYRAGVEVVLTAGFFGRAGVTAEPQTYAIGFGYSVKTWEVNLAVQHHHLLGLSPGFDLIFSF